MPADCQARHVVDEAHEFRFVVSNLARKQLRAVLVDHHAVMRGFPGIDSRPNVK